MTRINVVDTQVFEGTPEQLAQQMATRYVLELAAVIEKVHGPEGLLEYYTALTTCVLCQSRVAFGAEIAALLGDTCTRNATAAPSAHEQMPH